MWVVPHHHIAPLLGGGGLPGLLGGGGSLLGCAPPLLLGRRGVLRLVGRIEDFLFVVGRVVLGLLTGGSGLLLRCATEETVNKPPASVI